MKFFKRQILKDGEIFPNDAYVIWGRNDDNKSRFIIFNLPFIRKMIKEYNDPVTFNSQEQLCYYRCMIIRRKPPIGNTFTSYRSVWAPI